MEVVYYYLAISVVIDVCLRQIDYYKKNHLHGISNIG